MFFVFFLHILHLFFPHKATAADGHPEIDLSPLGKIGGDFKLASEEYPGFEFVVRRLKKKCSDFSSFLSPLPFSSSSSFFLLWGK